MLAQPVHAQSDEILREKFGEGGSHGLKMRALADEIHVGADGIFCRGQNSIAANRLFACEARGLDKLQPLFDSAGPRAVAIMVDDALAPSEAERRIVGAREDRCILDGNAALIGIAVQRPGLQLATREFSFVHQQVERMLMVVALLANGAELRDEVGFGKHRVGVGVAHSSNSIPS